MITTTTPSVEGRPITAYHGIVVGEAILGANVFRDLFAGITDIIGGRSGAYEEELGKARTVALQEMQDRAREMGGQCRGGHRSRLRGDQQHADGVRLGHGGDAGADGMGDKERPAFRAGPRAAQAMERCRAG